MDAPFNLGTFDPSKPHYPNDSRLIWGIDYDRQHLELIAVIMDTLSIRWISGEPEFFDGPGLVVYEFTIECFRHKPQEIVEALLEQGYQTVSHWDIYEGKTLRPKTPMWRFWFYPLEH